MDTIVAPIVNADKNVFPGQEIAVKVCCLHAYGCSAHTLYEWVRRHEVDAGTCDGVITAERDRIKDLEREVKELRRANEILKLASAFLYLMTSGRKHRG